MNVCVVAHIHVDQILGVEPSLISSQNDLILRMLLQL